MAITESSLKRISDEIHAVNKNLDRLISLQKDIRKDITNIRGKELIEKLDSCSWEKGVMDAWEYVRYIAESVASESRPYAVLKDFLDNVDPITYTQEFNRSRKA